MVVDVVMVEEEDVIAVLVQEEAADVEPLSGEAVLRSEWWTVYSG